MTSNAATRDRLAARKALTLRRRLLPALIAGCFASAFVAPGAVANPTGAQVVNGQATFNNQGNVLSVTNTPGAIINWQSFSINAGEVTRFIQQSADSAVLNRIVGQDPSQILGALQSNGRVFLVNPNGILFGQGAQIDVNGLVASTLNISNEDFLNGRMNFAAGDKAGKLQNQGAITTPAGGRVYLIAPNVENSGIITSPNGEVLLAAGQSVQLVDSANPDLHVVISAPESEAVNLGQIVAQGGKAGIYGALIHQRGLVSADSAVVGENGKIVFKASKDTILDAGSRTSATGAGAGGEIHILGERVGMVGDATVDASGRQGGGTVLVGGDFQGKNTGVQNAQYAYVGNDAEIKADATDSGDGGKVIIWSDNTTRAFGKISARGGAQSGNGGFVEVSGKQDLEYRALADLTAANGKTGTLLLDPASLTIIGGTGAGDAYAGSAGFSGTGLSTGEGAIFYNATPTMSVLYQSEIQAQSTTADIVLEATNNISVSGAFDGGAIRLANGRNLTMRTRNGSGDNSTGGGIDLTGSIHGADLAFETFNGGSILIEAGTASTPWFATLNLGRINAGDGAVTLRSSGSIGINNTVSAGNANVDVTAGGDITFTAAGRLYGGAVNVLSKGMEASISMPVGSEINSWGSPVSLTADNMSLLGTINAGSNTVTLAPFTALPSIVLGSNDDAITNMLALSAADLNSVRAGVLRIGNSANTGGIHIAAPLFSGPGGALEHVFNGLSMTTGGAITQQAGAIIAGASAVQATGTSVTLTEANATGVVAGTATVGDFRYRSSNLLTASNVDLTSGIRLTGSPSSTRHIVLESDSGFGINQNGGSPINTNGGGLVLKTVGPVQLWDTGNMVTRVAADLHRSGLGSGLFELYSGTSLEVGALDGISGITANNQEIWLTVGSGGSLAINQTVNAGTGEVTLEADSLALNSTVTGALADIAPVTVGRAITVGSVTCALSPCLNVVNLHRVAAHTIGIGREDGVTAGPIHVAGITNTGAGLLTDRNGITQRIGLLSAAGVSQSGAIDVHDLGVVAHGTVNLSNPANSVTMLTAETWGGDFTFANSKTFSVADLLGNELDNGDYGIYGIWSGGGNVSLSTVAGDISIDALDPINPGIDAVSGDVRVKAPGAIVVNGNVTTTGAITLDAGTAILGSGSVVGSSVTKLVNGVAVASPSIDAQLASVTNTVTSTTTAATSLLPTAVTGADAGAGAATSATGTQSSDNADDEQEVNQTGAATNDNGAKTNEAAKKMYCN
ncbi:hypothetical protein GCM10027343_29170 [Noviherbaspirillum agri]